MADRVVVAAVLSALVVGAVALNGVRRLEQRVCYAPSLAADSDLSVADAWEEIRRLRGEVASLRLSLSGALAAQKAQGASRSAVVDTLVASATDDIPDAPTGGDPEDVFRGEPVDAVWARSAVATLASAFGDEGAHVRVGSAECRSRTCRMEIKEMDSLDPAYLRVARQVAQHFSSLVAMKSRASLEDGALTVYFARSATASGVGL